MSPSLPTPTKVLAIFLFVFSFSVISVSGQQTQEAERTENTFYNILKEQKTGETTSIFVEPVSNSDWTPTSLVKDVFIGSGSCVLVSNISFTGDNRSIGYFKRNPNNPAFPFQEGIILSTGKAADAIGPNNFINISTELQRPGDPDLAKIATPYTTYDAAVLTFDFQPASNSVSFRYIFASDEYPQWACSQYNDVFAFFVSGPGIVPDAAGYSNGSKNIALLPDGITPVSINNIHVDGWNQYTHTGPNPACPDVNPEYYVAIAPGATTIEYDGRTVILTATLDGLTTCATYKLKLAIADVSDRKLDSAVFLEALSFETGSDIQFKNFNFKGTETLDIFRECNPNTLRIERTNGDITQAEVVTYTVSGTADYNVHHTLQGGTVTIPANETYIDIPYQLLDNPIPGGSATLVVQTNTGCLCDPDPVFISKTINIFDTWALAGTSTVGTVSCNDKPGSLTVSLNVLAPQYDFYFTYILKDQAGIILQSQSTQNTSYTFNGLDAGIYSVEISDLASCTAVNQSGIEIEEEIVSAPTLSLHLEGLLNCNVQELTIEATSNGSVEWFFEGASKGKGLQLAVSQPGTYTAVATNNHDCITTESIVVNQDTDLPVVTLQAFDAICSGSEPFALTGGMPAGGYYSGTGVDSDGNFDPIAAGPGSHVITYTYADPVSGCSSSASQTIHVNLTPCIEVVSSNVSCNGAENGVITVTITCGDQVSISLAGSNGGKSKSELPRTETFNNLGPGTYYVTAEDVNGCFVVVPVTITQPDALQIELIEIKHVSEIGATDGAIEIAISGGTPDYEILWNIGEITERIDELSPGVYTVLVVDANECMVIESFEVKGDLLPTDILVDLGVTIEVNIATPDPEEVDNLIFALVVTNYNTEEDATGVVVENTIPAVFPFIGRLDDETSGSFDPISGMWNIGTIPAGGYVILVYRTGMLLTEETKTSSAVNVAQILPFDQIDPNLLNNYAEVVVTVGESTGGDDNGIESNGSMASQLALRNHRRLVETRQIAKPQRREMMQVYSHGNMLVGKLKSARLEGEPATGISMMLPETGPSRTKAFISTPEDLLRITNAREIFAVDYLQENNARRAAILAISTEPTRVYEHTKVICDRLIGAELQDIKMMEIAGNPFIISKLVHPDGYVDYSVSFIAQRKANGFVIDNRWYNEEYKIFGSDDIFNFQVWSVTPQFTRELVEDILELMGQSGDITFRNNHVLPGIPRVYVQSGRYTNGGLQLNLVNNVGASQITISGNKTLAEHSNREAMNLTIDIPTDRLVEVFIPTGYLFDAGFSIENNKDKAKDVLYYADGPWMFDYDPGNATVSQFNTFAETTDAISKTYKVERNAAFSGNVRTWSSMFRTLAPRQSPVDLSEYDMVVFEAAGKGTVELILAKAGVKGWNEQYRATFTLGSKAQEYKIKFSDLVNKEGEKGFKADDVVSVVFNALGNGAISSDYEVSIKNLYFTQSRRIPKQNAVYYAAYPNPFEDKTFIEFAVMKGNPVKVEVMNIFGQVVEILKDEYLSSGDYKLNWKPVNQKNGLYMLRITIGEETYTSKLIYKN